ncbi:MAG: hypothetical protein RSC84_03190 [Peptostreptococcaceae bacterium]
MAKKNEQLNSKLDKEKKIKQEINKIKKLYKDFDKDKIKVLDGLITDSAFMKISLEEIREDLIKNGFTELFVQGTQEFNRERPEVKIYTTLFQRYSNVMKQLIDLLPDEEKKEQKDELLEFLQKGKL